LVTEDEATGQLSAFFGGLGLRASFSLPVTASVNEALLEFEYVDADQALSVLALIYRFRAEPRRGVIQAALAAASEANSGGGRLVLEQGRVLLLRRDFTDTIPDRRFADDVDTLAHASLLWAHEIFARAVEQAHRS
jgi:hypothetical protein